VSRKRGGDIEAMIIAFIAILFVFWSAAFIYSFSFIVIDGNRYFSLHDDAMISMRYAWNFSHGQGLVWNPGEYVEGYTNPLMTIIMSLPTLIFDKSTAVLAVQILGIGLMLGNAYVTMLIADHIGEDRSQHHRLLLRIISFFCVLYYYPLAYWTLMGMETGLLALFLLLGVLSALGYVRNQNPAGLLLMSVFLGAAYLTRPDSLIPGLVVFFFVLHETYKLKLRGEATARVFGAAAFYLLVILGHELFRWVYYGELVPNTYTLKITGIPVVERIANGLVFITPFLKWTAPVFAVIVADLALNFRKKKLILFSLALTLVFYQVWTGGDHWPLWRIIVPAMPLVLTLFVHGMLVFVDFLLTTPAYRAYEARFHKGPAALLRYVPHMLACLLIALGLVFANTTLGSSIIAPRKEESYRFQVTKLQYLLSKTAKHEVDRALAIKMLTGERATIGVFSAGSIPYYSGRRAVDCLGKSDKFIARLEPDLTSTVEWSLTGVLPPGHNKYDLNYSIKHLRPTYVEGFIWGRQDLFDWVRKNYVKVKYNDIYLLFLKDSEDVLWDKIGNVVWNGYYWQASVERK
jgi:hypothetical protein